MNLSEPDYVEPAYVGTARFTISSTINIENNKINKYKKISSCLFKNADPCHPAL